MNIKEFISKKTKIPLFKEAMPAAVGDVPTRNYKLQWNLFKISNIPEELPQKMKTWIENKISDWSFEDDKKFSLALCWYGKHVSVNQQDMLDIINSDHPYKD